MGLRLGTRGAVACLWAASLAAALLVLCAGCSSSAGVAVKDSVNDYSWEELSSISAEIAAVADEEAALDIARSYHLVNENGTLDGRQAKDIVLADGTATQAVIVGIGQDEKPGGGTAGITFMLADAVELRAMNNDAGYIELSESDYLNTVGGWAACDLRSWLNGKFMDMLPVDLSAVIVPVSKTSATVPRDLVLDTDSDALDLTSTMLLETVDDHLWLPSVSEVAGISDDSEEAIDDPAWSTLLKQEGSQYLLFRDAGASEGEPCGALIKTLASPDGNGEACTWWLRSIYGTRFYDVSETGVVDRSYAGDGYRALPSEPLGVVPFFSI